ncbi:MAG: hypothetical protein FJ304_24370 [Planctomycetes bacterium]|nr:hypothetical protein [Planctomycetota bacterium]
MALLSAVVCAHEILQSHFPKPGPAKTRREWLFFDTFRHQADFGRRLSRRFQWFVSVEDSVLAQCLKLPEWVGEIRDTLRAVESKCVTSRSQELWGEFLARTWLEDVELWEEPGVPNHSVYATLPYDPYKEGEAITITLTLCAFDLHWLADLRQHAGQPEQPQLIEFGDDWVCIQGGPKILVTDKKQLVLLQVLFEAKGTTPQKSLRKAAERYGCELPNKLSRLLSAMPEHLRALIHTDNAGYRFVLPKGLSDPK